MWLVVRFFFVFIAASIVLSLMLGWFALARARLQVGKMFNLKPRPKPYESNVIEGEYRVISEEEKN